MIKTSAGIYQSSLFTSLGVIHGFSTKLFGDVRKPYEQKMFYASLGINPESVIWQEQIHSDSIYCVSESDRGKSIKGVDGLIAKHISFPNKSMYLTVHTADCVPILVVDPNAQIIGVAHAGWKGTIRHVGKKLVEKMIEIGANKHDIRVCIGPRIGACCYDIDPEREDAFRREFPLSEKVILQRNGKTYLDIGLVNVIDLQSIGILLDHIDFDESLCTFTKGMDFYSYRKSGKPLDGEMIGIIGFEK
jgi:YfiH family protein